jgi:hypothetical protein
MLSNPKVNRRRALATTRRAVIDALEPRRMLATFNGTSGNDIIDVFNWAGGGMAIRINGVINTTTDGAIVVNGGLGNDTFNVSSSRSGTIVNLHGNEGNDSLMNPSVQDLDAVYVADFTFIGGAGFDNIVADNREDSTATTADFYINRDGIIKDQFNTVLEYAVGLERLQFFDNDAANRIGFADFRVNGKDVQFVELYGFGGNDAFMNNRPEFPDTGFWPTLVGSGELYVDGGTGTDTLTLNNIASGLNADFTVDAAFIDADIAGVTSGALKYFTFERIDMRANDAVNDVVISAKPPATIFTFDGLGGNDNITVGGGDLDTNGFRMSNTTLAGGAGTDSIRFEDQLDTDAAGETESYNFSNTLISKGSVLLACDGLENQTLVAADRVIPGQLTVVPIVNIVATSPSTNTTINGGLNRGSIVNVTAGNLGFLGGGATLNVNLGGPTSTLNINDQNASGNFVYEVTGTRVTRMPSAGGATIPINYSAVSTMTISAGSGSDAVRVNQTPAGMALTVNAGGGNDGMNLGNGNVDATLLGPVTLNGGSGANTATVHNDLDNAPETLTLNGATFIDGQSHTFSSLEKLHIQGGPGGTHFFIDGAVHQTDVHGHFNDDTFTIGGGDLDANLPAGAALGLMILGGAGNNQIILNDVNDTNLDSYIFQRPGGIDQFVKRDGGIDRFVSWVGIGGVTLEASNATGPVSNFSATVVENIEVPLRVNGNGGNDYVLVNDAAAPVTVHTGIGALDALDVNQDFDGVPVTVVIDQDDDIETLGIRAAGTLRITDGATLLKTRADTSPGPLSIAGVLDVGEGALISRAGGPSQASFQAWLASGYNGGAWNGTGTDGAINSSLAADASSPADAVGYGLGSDLAITSIGGFNIAAGDVLVRYTLYGDTDLNQVIDGDDYARTDNGFNTAATGWTNGDFDYNDLIDGDDYALIDLGFNSQ